MKRRRSLPVLILPVLTAFTQILSAQLTPYTMKSGIAQTAAVAASSLGSDAMLVQAGALGDTIVQSSVGAMRLQFDLASGEAHAWAYTYYSPSKDSVLSLVRIEVTGLGDQVMPTNLPVDLPAEQLLPLDSTLPYFDSDRMIARLATDTTFIRYSIDLPTKRPWIVGLRRASASEAATLPPELRGEQGLWITTFLGGKDTAMLCYVSAATGATYCHRASVAAGVMAGRMRTAPGIDTHRSADGVLHIVVQCDERPEISVYSLDGAVARSRPTLRSIDGQWMADVELEGLPSGVYFCRIAGNGWRETVPIGR